MPTLTNVRDIAEIPALADTQYSIDQVKLLFDQVLVEPIEAEQKEAFEQKTASGLLFIPQKGERDRRREVFYRGRVVKVGPGDKYGEGKVRGDGSRAVYAYPQFENGRFPLGVQVGDLVLYERRAGTWLNLGGKPYLVLHEEQHIAAVIDESDTWESVQEMPLAA